MIGIPIEQTVQTVGGADFTGLTIGILLLATAGIVLVFFARRNGVNNAGRLLAT